MNLFHSNCNKVLNSTKKLDRGEKISPARCSGAATWPGQSLGGGNVSATLIRGLQLLKPGLGHRFPCGKAGTPDRCGMEGEPKKAVGIFEERRKN